MSFRDLGVVAKRVLDRAVFIATAAVYPPCRDSSSSAEEREAFRVSYWSSVAQFDQAIQLSLGICPFAQPLLPATPINRSALFTPGFLQNSRSALSYCVMSVLL